MLHLFTDALSVEGTATLQDFDENNQPVSGLTYPHEDALWLVEHQGKQALRFESTVLGQLRGSLHNFHQPIGANDFELTCSTWLELDMEPAWTGITFWMKGNNHQAAGIRWRADGIQHKLIVEIIIYSTPELRTQKSIVYDISESRWSAVHLQVQGLNVSIQMDDREPLSIELDSRWRIGDNFGLFQGEGTGYFADLQWTANSETHTITRWNNWNTEMVNTAKVVVLDSNDYPQPEQTLGLRVPVRRIKLAKEWRSVVPVQCPSELRFQVHVPKNARLHVGYGILQPFSLSSTKAMAEVVVEENGKETVIEQREFQPRNESPRWFQYHDIHASLEDFADKEISLKLRIKPIEGDEPLVMCWSEPIITKNEKTRQPNVLLFLVDTLRADHIGANNPEKQLTTRIDEFAKSGTVFLNTISQAPWTTPSHASLFTSLYPSETNCAHTSNTNLNLLREGYWTWAEMLQENGYATGAFTNSLQVRGNLGFHQGFDQYHEIDYDSSYSIEANFEQFKHWLDEHQEAPWFTFMHTYTVHEPYNHRQFTDYRTLVRSYEDRRDYYHDAYDGGVRMIDEWFGIFLRELEQRGQLDNTIIILTSDHGEALGDRGMPVPAPHGHSLYDELLRVPLIISAPKLGVPNNKVVQNQARLIDLMPTVMELVGIEMPDWCHGLSLTPLMNGTEKMERPAFSEGLNYGFPLRSLRTSNYKLIQLIDPSLKLDETSTRVPVPTPASIQFFNLKDDPMETNNIAQQNDDKMKDLTKALNIITTPGYMIDPAFFEGDVKQSPPQLSPELIEQLNSLGYN